MSHGGEIGIHRALKMLRLWRTGSSPVRGTTTSLIGGELYYRKRDSSEGLQASVDSVTVVELDGS